MELLYREHHGSDLLYLSRADVVRCCAELNIVDIVRETLIHHERGNTVLPAEAYLGWSTSGGHAARSLAMHGCVTTADGVLAGVKVINGSLANAQAGRPRSQGFTAVFDPETARPLVLMESAYISAMRTAAVTAATATALCRPGPCRLAVLGCGTLARAHLATLPDTVAELTEIRLYDEVPERSAALAAALGNGSGPLPVTITATARDCVDGADLVVTVTTTTESYLAADWLAPGAVVAHISLDDLRSDAVLRAGLVLVDDWDLVRHDHRRLFGRMYRQGLLLGPSGDGPPDRAPDPAARRVDSTLGAVFAGRHPGRRDGTQVVVSNPFGLAILDVAVAGRVYDVARGEGLGVRLPV